MNKIRQVLRCYAAGHGTSSIAAMLEISRNTVKKYLHIFHTCGKSHEEICNLDEKSLFSLFHEKDCSNEPPPSPRAIALEKLLPGYMKRLKQKGMTKERLYLEYITEHPDGYSRSQFCFRFQNYIIQNTPIAHIEHKAGDKMFVDFAGDKLGITSPGDGSRHPVEVFVAILPCSQLTYVEAVLSQKKKEDFIHACENALHFYGGSPLAIVPDNLKSAVTRAGKWESEINSDFALFAEHYGCAVVPARVRKPRDKALVESAVKLIYRSIYPKLEGKVFHDLESLNAAIRTALEIHNNAALTGRGGSRRELFEELERDCLRPLNPVRFEMKHRLRATVQRNGHVRVEKGFYSVPYKFVGKKVDVLYSNTSVEIYYKYTPVAVHSRTQPHTSHLRVRD